MIKTVSFAPPRAASGAHSKSSSVAARSAAMQNAKARAKVSATPAPVAPTPVQPAGVPPAPNAETAVAASSVTSLFPKPCAPAEVSAAQAREQLQSLAPATKSSARSTSAPAKRSPRRAAPTELSLELFPADPAPVVEVEVETEGQSEVEAQPKVAGSASKMPTAAIEVAPPAVAVKRAKRTKVPTNLAEQYGQSLSKRVENGVELPVVEEDAPKKRLNRAERAARRELMNPDDDLRARLMRAQNAVPSAKPAKRPRGWRFDCGLCGRTSYFETPGALCSCGALAIKE